jgi:hypothetical protein
LFLRRVLPLKFPSEFQELWESGSEDTRAATIMATRRTPIMGIIPKGTTDHIRTIIRVPHTTGTTGIEFITATIVIITTTATRLT